MLDTERFCFVECRPAVEVPWQVDEWRPCAQDSASGSPCTALASGAGGRRKRRTLSRPMLRKPAPVALAREEPDKVEELLGEAKKQAARAEKAAAAVPWRLGVCWACRGPES